MTEALTFDSKKAERIAVNAVINSPLERLFPPYNPEDGVSFPDLDSYDQLVGRDRLIAFTYRMIEEAFVRSNGKLRTFKEGDFLYGIKAAPPPNINNSVGLFAVEDPTQSDVGALPKIEEVWRWLRQDLGARSTQRRSLIQIMTDSIQTYPTAYDNPQALKVIRKKAGKLSKYDQQPKPGVSNKVTTSGNPDVTSKHLYSKVAKRPDQD